MTNVKYVFMVLCTIQRLRQEPSSTPTGISIHRRCVEPMARRQ